MDVFASSPSNSEETPSIKIDIEGDIGPTVLFCNPNAGYYEFMLYEVNLICELIERMDWIL